MADGETYGVFDYLVDTIQRREPADDHVPQDTIIAALHHATAADTTNIAETAQDQGRYRLAETAINQALTAHHHQYGAEHPNTLARRSDLALVLHEMGRLEEAEVENRAVLEAQMRALGAEHPDILTSRRNLALVLHDLGGWRKRRLRTGRCWKSVPGYWARRSAFYRFRWSLRT